MIRRWKHTMAGALAVAVAVTAASAGVRTALAAESPAPLAGGAEVTALDPAQDGRNLFQGAFFLVGPEAGVVAAASKAPADAVAANQTPEVLGYVEQVTKKVGQLEPGFFAEFSQRLRSGDPFQVEQALDQGRQLVVNATEAMGGSIEPPGSYDPAASFFLVFVAVTAVAVASAAVGGNVVVLASHFWVGSSPLGDDLGEEQAIAILTQTFQA